MTALPHHIPQMKNAAGLEKKMDEIRLTMGKDGMKAPWDLNGKPLGSLGSIGGRGLDSSPLGAIGGGSHK